MKTIVARPKIKGLRAIVFGTLRVQDSARTTLWYLGIRLFVFIYIRRKCGPKLITVLRGFHPEIKGCTDL